MNVNENKLIVNRINSSQNGSYKCYSKNSIGESYSNEVFVNVLCKLYKTWTIFLSLKLIPYSYYRCSSNSKVYNHK